MNQRRIRITGRPSGLGKTRVFLWIGQNPWQGIDLQDIRLAPLVQPDVDPAPVPDAEDLNRLPDDLLDPVFEIDFELGGTAEDLQRLIGLVPDPLGFIGIHRIRPRRQLGMIDLDDRQDFDIGRVPQHSNRELAPGQEMLDDDRLFV
jgi:hypothetical protein